MGRTFNNDHFNASAKIGVQVGRPIGDNRVCTQLKIQQLLDVGFMKDVVMGLINENPMRQAPWFAAGKPASAEVLLDN